MTDFSHLFLALKAGCPPHAGLAIGFDRLVAVMQGRDSVRDVIAFPKDKNGKDLMAHAPTKLSKNRMAEYHLQIKDDKAHLEEAQAREIEARRTQALESLKELLDTITKLKGDPTTFEGSSKETTKDEPINNDSTSEETAMPFQQDAPPQYRPGELLPYAVMLYNQVGGKFLLESLKGFEAMIESLGKEMRESTRLNTELGETPPANASGARKASFHVESAATRLERLHSELRDEILSQLRSIETSHEPASRKGVEVLQSKLEESLEPVKLLYTSLKNLEPMIESLNHELEGNLRKYKEPESLKGHTFSTTRKGTAGDEQSSALARPSDPGDLSSGLPPSR
jgi:hypothetical protein